MSVGDHRIAAMEGNCPVTSVPEPRFIPRRLPDRESIVVCHCSRTGYRDAPGVRLPLRERPLHPRARADPPESRCQRDASGRAAHWLDSALSTKPYSSRWDDGVGHRVAAGGRDVVARPPVPPGDRGHRPWSEAGNRRTVGRWTTHDAVWTARYSRITVANLASSPPRRPRRGKGGGLNRRMPGVNAGGSRLGTP